MHTLIRFVTAIVFALALQTGAQAAEETLSALIPWEGEGKVYQISPGTVLFLGAFKGIIYVKTSEGELDEGFVRCPLSQKIDVASQETSASGHCMITPSGGDTVFAEWTCKGRVGGCVGRFDLTAGTGRFEGITGTSDMVVRSPMAALVADMSNGSVLRVSSGIAMLPKLEYRLAGD